MSEMLVRSVAVKILPHGEGLPLPLYASALAAGCDLSAALASGETLVLAPGARALVPTALVLALPPGLEAQLRPRSGIALRCGVTILNAPGTIDADYRGEIQVLLINFGSQPFTIERGMRIAQLVVAPVTRVAFTPVAELDVTTREAGAFGSTGVDHPANSENAKVPLLNKVNL